MSRVVGVHGVRSLVIGRVVLGHGVLLHEDVNRVVTLSKIGERTSERHFSEQRIDFV